MIAIVVSIIFYLSLVSVNIWGFGSLFLLLLNGKKQLKGSIMTTLFFPYKLIMSLFFLTKKIIAKYIYQNKEYELEIKL